MTAAEDTLAADLLREISEKLDTLLATSDDRPLLSVTQAYERLGMKQRAFYGLMERGEIAWIQVGAHRKFEPAEIDRWIATQRRTTEASDGAE